MAKEHVTNFINSIRKKINQMLTKLTFLDYDSVLGYEATKKEKDYRFKIYDIKYYFLIKTMLNHLVALIYLFCKKSHNRQIHPYSSINSPAKYA